MCTLLLAHRAHPDYPLVIAANRDEYYRRATAPAEFWASAPQVLAGRDLEAGGTWLGITTAGRWAGLTNIRDPQLHRDSARSRGWLVRDYLLGPARPEHYLAQLAEQRAHYGGFNLLVGDRDDVWYLHNRDDAGPEPVAPGVHGLSNATLDIPWPKVTSGIRYLDQALEKLERGDPDARLGSAALLDHLADTRPCADRDLPDTGVGRDLERVLSSLFIRTAAYGTCSSTVIAVHRSGEVEFVERTTNPTAQAPTAVQQRFIIDKK